VDPCGCDGFASIFDEATARRDRDRYRRDGPDRTTRLLLELLTPYRSAGSSVLDIGGGIGIVDLELLHAGAGHATLVDASTAYLAVARDEARRAGVLDRIEFVEGDFVRRASSIDRADVVTLDRVICCYPDMEALVAESAGRARTAYGIVLPRDRRSTRWAVALTNAWYRLRRKAYRGFVHSTARVDENAAANGLRLRADRQTWFWRVAVYDRSVATVT
jgi:ubiquinone/menaquinone biosynthesis C-methylase UbiE